MDRWIETSIDALAEALGYIESRTLRDIAKLPGFPKTEITSQTFEYDVLDCNNWILANPKCFLKDPVKHYRLVEYQKEVSKPGKRAMNLEYEKTRLIMAQADRAELKLKLEKSEVIIKADREEDEVERLEILKRRLYEQASSTAGELLSKPDISEMANATKGIIDRALSLAQDDWMQLNKKVPNEVADEELAEIEAQVIDQKAQAKNDSQ